MVQQSIAGEDGEVTYNPQEGASMQNDDALQQQVSSSLNARLSALHALNFDESRQKVGC